MNGEKERWHYLWNDTTMGGYSVLGNLFREKGATLQTLITSPTLQNLNAASIYIIADPDNDKETDKPNYMSEDVAQIITTWVNEGGTLVLFANDSSNCELHKFNILAQKFGITFNNDNRLVVQDPHFEQGEVKIDLNSPIFKTAKNIYLKGICSVSATYPAQVILSTQDYATISTGKVGTVLQPEKFGVIAVAKYGKGTVFALGDPWIYNEYIGHRRLPKGFENDKAAKDWVNWLMDGTQLN